MRNFTGLLIISLMVALTVVSIIPLLTPKWSISESPVTHQCYEVHAYAYSRSISSVDARFCDERR